MSGEIVLSEEKLKIMRKNFDERIRQLHKKGQLRSVWIKGEYEKLLYDNCQAKINFSKSQDNRLKQRYTIQSVGNQNKKKIKKYLRELNKYFMQYGELMQIQDIEEETEQWN